MSEKTKQKMWRDLAKKAKALAVYKHKAPKREYLVLNLLSATLDAKNGGDADRRIERMLNRHAKAGFRLVGVAFGNKAIMEAERRD